MTTAIFSTCKGVIHTLSRHPACEMEIDPPAKRGLFAHSSFAIIRAAGFTAKDAETVCDAQEDLGEE